MLQAQAHSQVHSKMRSCGAALQVAAVPPANRIPAATACCCHCVCAWVILAFLPLPLPLPLPRRRRRRLQVKEGELVFDPSSCNFFALKRVSKEEVDDWVSRAEKTVLGSK